jgi:crossover junction endodeoxyribonuclease RuvC
LNTGWGLLGGSPRTPKLLDAGVIRLADGPFPRRLARLREELAELLSRIEPTAAAVESPFHGVNARSALQLAHARGVVLAVLAGAGLDVAEYTPAAVKKTVTGTGGASKEQVGFLVERTVAAAGSLRGGDQADAIAVALCHLFTLGSPSLPGRR